MLRFLNPALIAPSIKNFARTPTVHKISETSAAIFPKSRCAVIVCFPSSSISPKTAIFLPSLEGGSISSRTFKAASKYFLYRGLILIAREEANRSKSFQCYPPISFRIRIRPRLRQEQDKHYANQKRLRFLQEIHLSYFLP